jgi:putative YphP/YqiW family bacilliredoxin
MNPADQPTYDPQAVAPMREELHSVGFVPVDDIASVDAAIGTSGTALLMVNSVCGCSAGAARPGVCAGLQNKVIPDRLFTVFAGQDKTALAYIRQNYLSEFQPSSPFIALFKDGQLLGALERSTIQNMDAQAIAKALSQKFDESCTRPGPSISQEAYEKLDHVISCGSKIPKFNF